MTQIFLYVTKIIVSDAICTRPKIGTSDGGQDNKYDDQHTRIRINDYEIDEIEETKFLGVTIIDNKLT